MSEKGKINTTRTERREQLNHTLQNFYFFVTLLIYSVFRFENLATIIGFLSILDIQFILHNNVHLY